MAEQNDLRQAGDVYIEELKLTSRTGQGLNVQDYLVELNLYEDMFTPFMRGTLILSDSANLPALFDMRGEETLSVRMTTPTLDRSISKTFMVYAIQDRQIANDVTTQVYTLQLCSVEAYTDSTQCIRRTFEGRVDELVQQIFDRYLRQGNSQLEAFSQCRNRVKIVSPGWTPMQLIRWLSERAEPAEGAASSFFFWESSKTFYFGSAETIIRNRENPSISMGEYSYSPMGVENRQSMEERLRSILSLHMPNQFDTFNAHALGYYASRVIGVDVIKKRWRNIDYDHVNSYNNYAHLDKQPPFGDSPTRTPDSVTRVMPIHPDLFKGAKRNANERWPELFGNRLSNVAELARQHIDITVHGRTDAEAGRTMRIRIPDVRPAAESEVSSNLNDRMLTGDYLITAINHKINPERHSMTMELVRDAVGAAQ